MSSPPLSQGDQSRITEAGNEASTVSNTMSRPRAGSRHKLPASVGPLDDGRAGTFPALGSRQARDQHNHYVRKQRAELAAIRRVLPNEPEEINVRITTSTSG